MKLIYFFALFGIIAFDFILTAPAETVSDAAYGTAADEASIEKELLQELNSIRHDAGLAPLSVRPLLASCAAEYAAYLAERGYLSHVDASGRRAVDRYRRKGGTSLRTGEVLGTAPRGETDKLFTSWLNSPTHRSLLLDEKWTHCGIGVAAGGPSSDVSELLRLFVVIQCIEHPFSALQVEKTAERLIISGIFRPPVRSRFEQFPLIHHESTIKTPDSWDKESGTFSFLFSNDKPLYYLYLGYKNGEKSHVFTDTITLFQ